MKEFLSKINLVISGMIVGYTICYMFGFDCRIVMALTVFLGFGLGNTVTGMLEEWRKK